ncbi:hypothetical protein [Abyssibius alkaniclasticus]|uniref:hypothetical protein n=1 Tax=Abyssibius alkaniclasticus TaxID=2881234 RepID=UPI004059E180
MTKDQREIQRKLRILCYAEKVGHVANAVSEANVFSTIGACMMRTGWTETGIDYLSQPCLVVRP